MFATKPYICGSNYLLKMSDYKKGDWCDVVDGLYWRFIDKHREFFANQPRLALMPKALDRLSPERRKRIFSAAEQFLTDFTLRRSTEPNDELASRDKRERIRRRIKALEQGRSPLTQPSVATG